MNISIKELTLLNFQNLLLLLKFKPQDTNIKSYYMVRNQKNIPNSFPKSLSYTIKKMQGGMSRIGVKLTPDRTTGIVPNDVITYKLPNSSLCDLRTFNFFYQFSTSGTTGTFLHPRYASSLIERISIIINGQTIDITPGYSMLYNTLMDLEGSSFDQFSKRNVCEFFDPSLKCSVTDPSSSSTADVAIVGNEGVAFTITNTIS